MRKLSLHIGNNYPGTDYELSGCVNDAMDFSLFFSNLGYSAKVLRDQSATKPAIIDSVQSLLGQAKRGDKVAITNSSHGSYIVDQNGDEPDDTDEVIVCANLEIITDDELYALFKERVQGVQLFFFSDSCHSGSVHRMMPTLNWKQTKVRFLPPQNLKDVRRIKELPPRQRQVRATREMASAVLFSGCEDLEYSYDAWFNSRANGAFTRTAIDTYKLGMSLKRWHKEIRKLLPSLDYPQTPQLQATANQLNWRI